VAPSNSTGSTLPGFDRPPVVEAVVGVEFAALPVGFVGLSDFHRLWSDDYPNTNEVEALAPSQPVGQPNGPFQIQWGSGVPSLRLWSMAEGNHWLVQVQADRLVVNWRQLDGTDVYPHYDEMKHRFDTVLNKLNNYVVEQGIGQIQPLVVEYAYVNQLPGEFEKPEYVYSIFSQPPHALPGDAVITRFQTVRRIERGGLFGQLSIGSEPLAVVADRPAVNLTVSTKFFMAPSTEFAAIDLAVSYAHESSVEAFAAVTSADMHERWGRNDSSG
jgi:uncharacterized protein (TIGR04255 family)